MAQELWKLERREARGRTNLSVTIKSGREENRRYRTASGSDRPLIKVSVDNKRPVATARGSVTTCLPTFNWRTGLISPQRAQRFAQRTPRKAISAFLCANLCVLCGSKSRSPRAVVPQFCALCYK